MATVPSALVVVTRTRDDSWMKTGKTPQLREGHQLYDPINGVRVGALAGGLLGAGAVVMLGGEIPLLVVAGALIGGLVGYVFGRRQASR